MSGLAPLAFGGFLLPLGVVILAIVAVAGGRAEPDPLHERPAALYLTAVSFLAVFAVLFAVFGLSASVLNLTIDHHGADYSTPVLSGRSQVSIGSSGVPDIPTVAPLRGAPSQHDGDYRGIVVALIAGLLAAALFLTHDRWLRRYLAERVDGPGVRVWHTYLSVACFFAVLVAIPAVGAALYDLFKLIAPGVTNAGSRGDAAVAFGGAAVLATGAGIVFLFHWDQSPLATTVGWTPLTHPAAPPPPPPLPPPEEPPPPPAPVRVRTTKATKASKATKAVKKR